VFCSACDFAGAARRVPHPTLTATGTWNVTLQGTYNITTPFSANQLHYLFIPSAGHLSSPYCTRAPGHMLPEKYHRGRLPLVRAFRVTGSWFRDRLGFELEPGADVHGERANVPLHSILHGRIATQCRYAVLRSCWHRWRSRSAA